MIISKINFKLSTKKIKIFLGIIILKNIILISHRVSFNIQLLSKSFKPNGGLKESLLPTQYYAIEILEIVNKYQLKDFKLSKNFYINGKDQRALEVLYPTRIKASSKNLFYFKKNIKRDLIPKNCKLIDTSIRLNYYECR